MAWHWADEGTPPGKTVQAGVGVLTVMDTPSAAQRPYAFVEGSDSHLWVRWWSAGPLVRKGVWDLEPATAFSSEVMRQYAIAVWTMRKRDPATPTSWMYQANIHFTFIPQNQWPSGAPWDQCPHGSLFFFPWHRMYIYCLEQIVNSIAQEHGATGAWTLPYWDWTNHPTLPLAFRNETLPAGFTMPDGSTKNPLYVPYPNRSGLGINDANALPPSSVSLACFKDLTFSQFDGDYEETPHGDVHVQVGGASAPGSCNKAWMTQVPCAAQDPIFWLHHANVDRCWDGWLRQGGGRSNPTDASWLNGQYTLFAPNGTAKQMKVQDVLDSAKDLGYVYDQYPAAPAPLIAPAVAPAVPVAAEVVPVSEQRLVAETTEPVIRLTGQTTVSANVVAQEQGVASSEALGAPEAAGTVTLNVEGIDLDAHPGVVYEIYVNLPEGETPDFRSPHYVGNLSLFGVMPATMGQMGHEHPSYRRYDITDQFRVLSQQGQWPSDKVTLTFVPRGLEGTPPVDTAPAPGGKVPLPEIRIGKVTITRG